jgi:hypothetical protein
MSVTNISGTNAGPNVDTAPDISQLGIGNVWKDGVFTFTLSPASVANATSAEQTFTFTGMLATDFVSVDKPTAQAGLGIVGTRAGAGFFGITFMNTTAATITPTASEVYVVYVARILPNWTQPTSGNVIDWSDRIHSNAHL